MNIYIFARVSIELIQKLTYQQGQNWQLFLPTSGLV
jgi:hypothetical protein